MSSTKYVATTAYSVSIQPPKSTTELVPVPAELPGVPGTPNWATMLEKSLVRSMAPCRTAKEIMADNAGVSETLCGVAKLPGNTRAVCVCVCM